MRFRSLSVLLPLLLVLACSGGDEFDPLATFGAPDGYVTGGAGGIVAGTGGVVGNGGGPQSGGGGNAAGAHAPAAGEIGRAHV